MVFLQAVLPLRLCWHGHGIHPVRSPLEWFRPRDEAEFFGPIEAQLQAAAVFCVKGEVDIVPQVGLERPRRQFEVARCIKADLRDALQPEVAGGDEVRGHLWSSDVTPCGPDRENRRQSGQASPFTHYVIDIEQLRTRDSERGGMANRLPFRAGPTVLFDAQRNAQRRIADEQRGISPLQHLSQVWWRFKKLRRGLPLFGAQDAGQRLRAARTEVQRKALRPFDRFLRDDEQAADLFLRSNGYVRQNHQIRDALVFYGRNDGDVRGARAQLLCALRRNRERQLVLALQRAIGEAPNERRRVEVLNDGDAKFGHDASFP